MPSLTKAPSHTKAPGARKLRPCSLIGWLISALPGEGGLGRAPLGPLHTALPQGSGLNSSRARCMGLTRAEAAPHRRLTRGGAGTSESASVGKLALSRARGAWDAPR